MPRNVAPLAWAPLAGGIGLAAFAAAVADAAGSPGGEGVSALDGALPSAFALAFASVGGLVASRQPSNALGWVLGAFGLVWALLGASAAYATYASAGHGPEWAGKIALWIDSWAWFPAIALPGTFVLLLFPTGRLPSRRWRPVAWLAASTLILGTAASMLHPAGPDEFEEPNPFGFSGTAGAVVEALALLAIVLAVACFGLSAASLVARYRSAAPDVRIQIKWVVYAGGMIGIAFPLAFFLYDVAPGVSALLQVVATLALGTCIAIGILWHGLFDVDVVINRTLLAVAMTAVVVGSYAAVVGLAGIVLADVSDFWTAAVAAGAAAVVAHPARVRLQRWIDRLSFGDRDDPYAALTRLGQRLEVSVAPEDVLPAVVDTVAQALKVPYVAIELEGEARVVSATTIGGKPGGPLFSVPVLHRGAEVGRLVASARSPREPLRPRDRRLLEDLARQAGAAVASVRLTAELQLSRERLVASREEERRRLRRDLHDGLGPTLAAAVLKVDAARRLLRQDPTETDRMLQSVADEARSAIGDVRRLVYDLRPPALDELGLVDAIREQASRLTAASGPRVEVRILATEPLPPLPAAVEVAAYRIAAEALTNVARHANAGRCTVTLALNGALELVVADDGRGLARAAGRGLGLASMRERARELGGTCDVEAAAGGGTRVLARLPLGE